MKPDDPMGRSKGVMESPTQARPHPPAGQEEEEAWVERAKKGDEEAFRMLVERYREQAFGLALRIVRSPSDAEEVAQDAFVRAWAALPRFRGESRFGTWLHSIVSRRAIDRAKQLKGRHSRETVLDDDPRPAAAVRDEEMERIELRQLTDRLLDTLSDTQRAVVSLFYLEDRSIEQVAASLGMPLGTVKTHLFRARGVLRQAWSREHSQGEPGEL
jgi:RNA polymerase sigma-70 factor (ECF subfamily)